MPKQVKTENHPEQESKRLEGYNFEEKDETSHPIKYDENPYTKPNQCVSCDYSCITAQGLKRHSYTHTGEKPYQCTPQQASIENPLGNQGF